MDDSAHSPEAGETDDWLHRPDVRLPVPQRPQVKDAAVRIVGKSVAGADAEAIAGHDAAVQSLIEELGAIVRCHPDDLPLW